MRTRYAFDAESGLLIDRDGNVLGRVVSITLDSKPGGYGGGSTAGETNNSPKDEASDEGRGVGRPSRPTPSQLEAAAIDRCWSYYLEVVPSKRKLDAKRKRFLRDAIRLVGEDATKLALLGLSRSPWHNGENPSRRKYLDLRYALKGIGDESDDERIEKAISWAALHAPNSVHMDEARVQRHLDDIRFTLSSEHHPERKRAKESWTTLRAAGFRVIKLDKAPWARLER